MATQFTPCARARIVLCEMVARLVLQWAFADNQTASNEGSPSFDISLINGQFF